MFQLVQTAAPAAEPVSVAECKLDSRVDGTEFDTLLPTLISAAREMCETAADRKLITQTWRATADGWPGPGETFTLGPVQSATVTYWTGSTWATLAADQWALLPAGGALRLLPSYGAEWPALGDLVGPRVRIDVECGYGDAAAVPASLKMWIRAHVAAMLRAPDALGDDKKMAPLHYLDGLIDPHRVWAI